MLRSCCGHAGLTFEACCEAGSALRESLLSADEPRGAVTGSINGFRTSQAARSCQHASSTRAPALVYLTDALGY